MEVRPATLEDWSILALFIEANNQEQHGKYGVPDFTRLHLDTVHHAIKCGAGGVWVAFDNEGTPIGMTANFHFASMPVGYVEGGGTYVLPEYRRGKVAHALGTAALAELYERGGRETWGNVSLRNQPSIDRCIAEGAEIVGLVLRYRIPKPAKAAA